MSFAPYFYIASVIAAFVGGVVVSVGVPKAVAVFKAWAAAREQAIYEKVAAEKTKIEADAKKAINDAAAKV